MPHQLVVKYLSSKSNFVLNETLKCFQRGKCRNDTFKRFFTSLLFLKKAVSHVSAFYVCQPIIFNLFISIILNLVTVSFDFYLAFTAPDEGEFCLTEILGNKIITLLSCPISLAIGFLSFKYPFERVIH